MTSRQATKVSRNLRQSPREIERAIRAFSANARSFAMNREETLEKYRDKWIAAYKGAVIAEADSQDELVRLVEAKNLSANEVFYRRIDAKEKVFIL